MQAFFLGYLHGQVKATVRKNQDYLLFFIERLAKAKFTKNHALGCAFL